MKIQVVIVNYKTAEMTLDAVRTTLREVERYPDTRITVVDNDSQDGSLDKLKTGVVEAGWSDRVEVVGSPRNGGFAFGCNFAIGPALESSDPPDYIYLLNSDAFPDSRAIEFLVEHLDSHPEVGIAGSYIHGTDPERSPHTTAFRFPSVLSEFEATLGIGLVSKLLDPWIVAPPLPTTTTRVDWLAGASMMIRREVFEAVGLLDDGYFLYFEETDFCLRAARAGWPTDYVVESSVAHIGSVSTNFQDLSRPTPTYWYASRSRYFWKNHGRATLWLANLVYIVGGLIRRARSFVMGRASHEPNGHMRHFLRFNLRPSRIPDCRPNTEERS